MTESDEKIVPATTQTIAHSFWVGVYSPETGPQAADIYDVQHIVVAWKLIGDRPVPILFPTINYDASFLPISEKPLFVGILMPNGHFKNVDGDDVRTDIAQAKEGALYDAQRWWHEHDR